MKNLFSLALVAAIAMPAFAQEEEKSAEATPQAQVERKRASVAGPTFFAVSEFPASQDVTGLRLTIPFSTKQENVTGIDLGLWGRALYFQGFQINILRNDVKDDMSGFQCGLYNSIGSGQLLGLQVGLYNEANFLRGVQAGLINLGGEVEGLQIGLINEIPVFRNVQLAQQPGGDDGRLPDRPHQRHSRCGT